tara:strand:+ start:709 stop:882 length:174 start_codon:yes stop_codon:yes gene_type:complete
VTHNDVSIFEPLDTPGKRFSVTLIVVNNRRVSLLLVDNKAMDAGNIMEQTVAFQVEH